MARILHNFYAIFFLSLIAFGQAGQSPWRPIKKPTQALAISAANFTTNQTKIATDVNVGTASPPNENIKHTSDHRLNVANASNMSFDHGSRLSYNRANDDGQDSGLNVLRNLYGGEGHGSMSVNSYVGVSSFQKNDNNSDNLFLTPHKVSNSRIFNQEMKTSSNFDHSVKLKPENNNSPRRLQDLLVEKLIRNEKDRKSSPNILQNNESKNRQRSISHQNADIRLNNNQNGAELLLQDGDGRAIDFPNQNMPNSFNYDQNRNPIRNSFRESNNHNQQISETNFQTNHQFQNTNSFNNFHQNKKFFVQNYYHNENPDTDSVEKDKMFSFFNNNYEHNQYQTSKEFRIVKTFNHDVNYYDNEPNRNVGSLITNHYDQNKNPFTYDQNKNGIRYDHNQTPASFDQNKSQFNTKKNKFSTNNVSPVDYNYDQNRNPVQNINKFNAINSGEIFKNAWISNYDQNRNKLSVNYNYNQNNNYNQPNYQTEAFSYKLNQDGQHGYKTPFNGRHVSAQNSMFKPLNGDHTNSVDESFLKRVTALINNPLFYSDLNFKLRNV